MDHMTYESFQTIYIKQQTTHTLTLNFLFIYIHHQIKSEKVEFGKKAQSKVGSMDNVQHTPRGGDVKVSGAFVFPCNSVVFR